MSDLKEKKRQFKRIEEKLLSFDAHYWRNDREKKVLGFISKLKRYCKGNAPQTIKKKVTILIGLESYFYEQRKSLILAPNEIHLEELSEYFKTMSGKIENSSIKLMRTYTRWFLARSGQLKKMESRSKGKFKSVFSPRSDNEKKSYILTRKEVDSIIAGIKNKEHRTFFSICYFTASRLNDVLTLKAQKVYESSKKDSRCEIWDSKRFNYKTAMISNALRLDIESVFEISKVKRFKRGQKEKGQVFSCSESALRDSLNKSLLKLFGKDKLHKIKKEFNLSTHCFRVARATHLKDDGIDLREIMKITNHASIETLIKCYARTRSLDAIFERVKSYDERGR